MRLGGQGEGGEEMRTTLEMIQEQGEEKWLQPMHGDALRLHQCLSGTLRNMTTDLRAYTSKLSREQNIDMLEFALGFLVRRVLGKPFICPSSVFGNALMTIPNGRFFGYAKGRAAAACFEHGGPSGRPHELRRGKLAGENGWYGWSTRL